MSIVQSEVPGSWRSVYPAEAVPWLAGLSASWWIAGGWALDLFLGDQSRPHTDLDVGIFRDQVREVISALPGWEFFEAKDGSLNRLGATQIPRPAVNSLWCRPIGSDTWALELMLDEREYGQWVFRRDRRIQRSIATTIRYSSEGIPYLAPEVQLLYKARNARPKDQDDFERIAPQLVGNDRAWLKSALCTTDPGHDWISKLDSIGGPSCIS